MFNAEYERHQPTSCQLYIMWVDRLENETPSPQIRRTLIIHETVLPLSLRPKDLTQHSIKNKNEQTSLGSEFRVTKHKIDKRNPNCCIRAQPIDKTAVPSDSISNTVY